MGDSFPQGFLWGAATSAYQVEGSPLADGAGASIWHRFSHEAGRIKNGDTGDVACDHYRRYEEDIALMGELGLGAYRFSISWSRVLPEGRGRVNSAGLAFYERLVDTLLESGIQPMITLYHWDLPGAIDDLGGWVNRDVAGWFADYAEVCFRAMGDRVPMWATLNEPWVITDAGYLHGVHAPGHKSRRETPLASHNLLRAHGAAVERFRGLGPWASQVGIVVNLEPKEAATDSPEDRAAAERSDAYMNRQYLDPLYFGRYPEELAQMYGRDWPEFPESDFASIRQPIDFLGINYYKRGVMKHDPAGKPEQAALVKPTGGVYSKNGWESHPPSLTRILRWVHERYAAAPLYVTENGFAAPDPDESPPGGLDDSVRVEYYRGHLAAARNAIAAGVDLRGYFAWSLLDNFEWGEGYSLRFGLVHVNFKTQKRTPKASYHFYHDVIESNGAAISA
ncbi:MAG TPA: GH1 family beta-glucosidase [Candidatus Eisenbacteria bacterium]|nr:GH1 family beta-glucosidase [Candidatus Eisenbacteria bacterium]